MKRRDLFKFLGILPFYKPLSSLPEPQKSNLVKENLKPITATIRESGILPDISVCIGSGTYIESSGRISC